MSDDLLLNDFHSELLYLVRESESFDHFRAVNRLLNGMTLRTAAIGAIQAAHLEERELRMYSVY